MKIGDIQGISIEALKKIKGLGGMCLTEVRAKASAKEIMIITDEYV